MRRLGNKVTVRSYWTAVGPHPMGVVLIRAEKLRPCTKAERESKLCDETIVKIAGDGLKLGERCEKHFPSVPQKKPALPSL